MGFKMRMNRNVSIALLGIVLLLLATAVGYLLLNPPIYFSFDYIKTTALNVQTTAAQHPIITFSALVVIHLTGMVIGVPTKGVFNIVAGALLGIVFGIVATVLGVYLGTTILFLLTRHHLRHRYEKIAGSLLKRFENRMNAHPIRTMASLRLLITLPFGPITVMSALSQIRYRHFLVGSVLGDLPVIIFYAVAGQQLANLNTSSDAISPQALAVLLSVAVLLIASTFYKRKKDQ
jgi:uncharacterized membrane protein YdjX (TVP38/TMEM64 family)